MVKKALLILTLVGLAFSSSQSRKLFHEHFDDFVNIIVKESGDQLDDLIRRYLEYDEFSATLEYMKTNKFKNIVYEMQSLPEFKAVVDFLENDNIDIHYYLDKINTIIERPLIIHGQSSGIRTAVQWPTLDQMMTVIHGLSNTNNIENNLLKRKSHYGIPSNKDLTSFIQDSISLFPQKKLAALYHEKMANDKEFRSAMVNLQSDEWDQIFSDLWDSDEFIKEVKTLKSKGIDIHEVLHQIIAVFGQY